MLKSLSHAVSSLKKSSRVDQFFYELFCEKGLFFLALVLGLGLRIWAACVSTGVNHPNETYRLLEPIAALQGYSTRLPWEWTEGAMSRLPALAHFNLLRLLTYLGVSDVYFQTVTLRIVYALLNVFPVVATYRLSKNWGVTTRVAGLAALFVALWPEFIFQSVRLMDSSLEMSFLAAVLLLSPPKGPVSRIREISAGVFLGLLFFVRPQTGLYGVCFLFARLLGPSHKTHIGLSDWIQKLPIWMGLGYLITVLGFAAIEPQFSYLHPFIYYITWNLKYSATVYGSAPWHRYLSEILKMYGITAFIFLLPFAAQRKVDSGLRWFLLIPFLVHSLIAHKEGRFIIGFAWLLVPLAATGAGGLLKRRKVLFLSVAMIGLGFVLSIRHNLPRFFARAEEARRWNEIGSEIQKNGEQNLPIWVEADPDFLPGAFYLRTRGPLCYKTPAVKEGDCASFEGHGGAREQFYLHLTISSNSHDRGWKVSKVPFSEIR